MTGLVIISLSIFMIISLGGLGGLFAEKSGVINIGIEGMMAGGALGFAISGALLHQHGNSLQFLSLVISMIIGILVSLLHAFVSITLKGNQIVSGIAINMLVTGLSLFIINGVKIGDYVGSISTGYTSINLWNTGFFSTINVMIIICIILLIIAYVILNKTRWGQKIKAVGENPEAVAALGINVKKVRYSAVLLSGAFAGFAGGMFMIVFPSYTGSVQGYGFISLAIMIFGQWRVKVTAFGAMLFAILNGLALKAPYLDIGYISTINKDLLNMTPFVLSLLVLVLNSKRSRAPRAIGEPYHSSK